MDRIDIIQEIEKILDEWDPIGILKDYKPLNYSIKAIGEYHNYIKPIVVSFINNQSIEAYLIELKTDLVYYPLEEELNEIREISQEIMNLLKNYSINELKELL